MYGEEGDRGYISTEGRSATAVQRYLLRQNAARSTTLHALPYDSWCASYIQQYFVPGIVLLAHAEVQCSQRQYVHCIDACELRVNNKYAETVFCGGIIFPEFRSTPPHLDTTPKL